MTAALAEIDLDFADGTYTFRLPLRLVTELQTKRGYQVTWPDGSMGVRPKAFGTIWREQMTGEYDVSDCREIVRLALIGGNQGQTPERSESFTVSAVTAENLVATYFDPMPKQDQWDLAKAILIAVAQGYAPPPGDKEREGDAEAGEQTGRGETDTSTLPE